MIRGLSFEQLSITALWSNPFPFLVRVSDMPRERPSSIIATAVLSVCKVQTHTGTLDGICIPMAKFPLEGFPGLSVTADGYQRLGGQSSQVPVCKDGRVV